VRDLRDLARAIERLVDDADLCADLVARGRKRAAEFSLDAYTERMGRLYHGLIAAAVPTGR
jgi:glycosyltransferase involved in cell wall biosynthesis